MEIPGKTRILYGAWRLPWAGGAFPQSVGFDSQRAAGVSDYAVRQFQPWGRWEVQTFYPPAPPGVTPSTLQADIHFSRFITVFMAVVE